MKQGLCTILGVNVYRDGRPRRIGPPTPERAHSGPGGRRQGLPNEPPTTTTRGIPKMKLPKTPPADDLRYLTEQLNNCEVVIETLNEDIKKLNRKIRKLKSDASKH